MKHWYTIKLFVLTLSIVGFTGNLYPVNAQDGDAIEVYLSFRHRGVINTVVVSYYNNDLFYLPVTEIFSVLKFDAKTVALTTRGKFSAKQIPYSIDLANQSISFGNNNFELSAQDFLVKELDNYITLALFSEVFGLNFSVDFNNLSLVLETNVVIPILEKTIRDQKRKIVDSRTQFSYYKLQPGRKPSFVDGGFLDYSLSSNYTNSKVNYNYNTALGLQLAGGDLQGSLYGNYSNGMSSISADNLRWQYVLRDSPIFTKITVGQSNLDGSLLNAYTGIRITNEPIEPLRLFDEYEIDGNTFPESEVELYLNNSLINFQKADALGNYRFLTPLYYGSSQLDLKIYGPTGQALTRRSRIQVPFSFTPKGKVFYYVNAGQLDNPIIGSTEKRIALQGNASVGLTSWLTSKVGFEYFGDGLETDFPVFSTKVSSRILKSYILSFEGVSQSFYRTSLNVIYPDASSFKLDYTNFISNSRIYNSAGSDKQFIVNASKPFKVSNQVINLRATAFTRLRGDATNTTFRLDGNTRIKKINLRIGYSDRLLNSYDLFNPSVSSTIESSFTYNVSKNPNLPSFIRGSFIRGQMRYLPKLNKIESAEILLSRQLFNKGRMQASIGKNFFSNFNFIRFNFVFDFNKVRSNSTFSSIKNNFIASQNIRGSVGYDSNYGNFLYSSRNQVGRSGSAIRLFVDNNANDLFDEGDSPIEGGNVRINSSGSSNIQKDGVIYYTQMQSNFRYNMEMNKNSIKNPMLVPKLDKFSIITDPNTFKKIDIPFYMSGIIEGMIQRQYANGEMGGIGGLKVLLTSKDDVEYLKELRTFTDGSFYEYEIPPGKYELRVEQGQLNILDAVSQPEIIEFEVKAVKDGDFVEDLLFSLLPKSSVIEAVKDTAILSANLPAEKSLEDLADDSAIGATPVIRGANALSINYNIAIEALSPDVCRYNLQFGTYSSFQTAFALLNETELENTQVLYNAENNLYAVRSGAYNSLGESSVIARNAENKTFPVVAVVNQCGDFKSFTPPPMTLNTSVNTKVYHVQFGAFKTEDQSQRHQKDILNRYQLNTYLTKDLKDNLYKVRLGPFESKTEATEERKRLMSSAIGLDMFITTEAVPKPVMVTPRATNSNFAYHLQFGAFKTEEQSERRRNEIRTRYQIDTYLTKDQKDGLYKIRLGPFNNQSEAISERNNLLSTAKGLDMFVTKEPTPSFVKVSFNYALQLGEFRDENDAALYAIRIDNGFGIRSKIVIDEKQQVSLLTAEAITSWTELLDLKKLIDSDSTFTKPVIQLVEMKQ